MSAQQQRPSIRLVGRMALWVMVGAWPAAAADVPLNPAMLEEIGAATLYAESFEDAKMTTEGLSGRALKMTSDSAVPQVPADILNRAEGTLSWWVRYEPELLEKQDLLLLNNGQLYLNYFGGKAWDFRHRHRLGHFWCSFGGPTFMDYHPGGIKPGVWSFLALTWSGSTLELYHQGQRGCVVKLGKPFSALPFRAFILGKPLDGAFDEVRAYNRALASEEIAQMYSAITLGNEQVRALAFARPQALASRQRAGLRVAYWASDHRVRVYANLSSLSAVPLDLTLTLLAPDGKELAARAWQAVDPARAFAGILDPGGRLPDGEYTVRLRAADQTQTARFTRVREVWEDNTIGITDAVPAPWTPIAVNREGLPSPAAVSLRCWGRTYTLDPAGLPASITAWQPEPAYGVETAELLARPARLALTADGVDVPLVGGSFKVTERTDRHARWQASASSPRLSMTLDGMFEYDGFCRLDFTFTPGAGAAAPSVVDELRLDIPVPDAQARLFNAAAPNMRGDKVFLDIENMPDGELWTSMRGRVTSSDDGREQVIVPYEKDPYWAQAWLGNDDRGLAVAINDDREWPVDPKTPKLRLVRKNGETTLQVRFVNAPTTIAKPFTASLALQATPIRPRPPGNSWRQVPTYGWAYFDLPAIYADCFDDTKPKQAEERPWYSSEQAKKDGRWWRYGCLQSFRTSVDDPTYGAMIRRNEDEWGGGGMYTKSHQDFLLWVAQQWNEKKGLTGYYFDNTMPRIGWVYSQREYLQRLRSFFLRKSPEPVLYAHMSDAPMIATLGHADLWLDGENMGYVGQKTGYAQDIPKNLDFVDRWASKTGLVNLRVTLGRQWGTMPRYLYSYGTEATQAVLGMFNLDHAYRRIDRLDLTFGIDQADCRWLPYWDIRKPATVVGGDGRVYVTAWTRPGRARVMVSNLAAENREVALRFDRRTLGLPEAVEIIDEITGERVAGDASSVQGLAVNRHDYRVLLLAAPGVFAPVPEALPAAMTPKPLIQDVSDRFDTLSPAWSFHVTPNRAAALGGPSIDRGRLRMQGDLGSHTLAQRPFGRDHVAVQVKVRSIGRWQLGQGGPSLILAWENGAWVRVIAGAMYGGPPTDELQVRSSLDAKAFQAQWKPTGAKIAAGTATWLRMELRPDAIVFLASVDAKKWTAVGTLARKGFKTAPEYLLLGTGTPGKTPFLRNDAYGQLQGAGLCAWFDDLQTGELP
jgi:hypothetical protein